MGRPPFISPSHSHLLCNWLVVPNTSTYDTVYAQQVVDVPNKRPEVVSNHYPV